jgi:hypothetical protein
MVCTLESGWISANSHKSGEVSVERKLRMLSHMPVNNLIRRSILSYMNAMDMGYGKKDSAASTKA